MLTECETAVVSHMQVLSLFPSRQRCLLKHEWLVCWLFIELIFIFNIIFVLYISFYFIFNLFICSVIYFFTFNFLLNFNFFNKIYQIFHFYLELPWNYFFLLVMYRSMVTVNILRNPILATSRMQPFSYGARKGDG